jgi:aldehyde dehydrogenase (NAD+)
MTNPHATAAAELAGRVRTTYDEGRTRPPAWRREQLQGLVALVRDNEAAIVDALRADLGKPPVEGYLTDVGFVVTAVREMIRNLHRWNRTERVRTPLVTQPGRSRLVAEPLGTVLVIAPWNYPVQLLLVPAAGALAAGNAVVLKPSEISAATSALLARLVPRYLDPDAVALVEGGVAETTALLEQRWDHIFFTGNPTVGRVVMAAAARHLTPVTLELGGKSPAIVDRSADLRVAARRIAWGKWLNAGQTCVAPDHVLVHESVRADLIDELRRAVTSFYGRDPRSSGDYGRIVSDRHLERQVAFLGDGRVVFGGEVDRTDRYVAPTVLEDPVEGSRLMTEEIFGPLLPVVPFGSIDEAIARVNAAPRPLALYVFGADRAVVDAVVARTSAGGVTVNGTIVHLLNPRLPFGGVGESGMGAYHGEAGVRVFQHRKPVLERSTRIDPALAYPPLGRLKAAVLRRLV